MDFKNIIDMLYSRNGKSKMNFIQLMEFLTENEVSYQDVKSNETLFNFFISEFTDYCCKVIMQKNSKCIRMRNILTPLANITHDKKGLRDDDIANMQEAAAKIFIKLDKRGFVAIYGKPEIDIFKFLSTCCYRELVSLVRQDNSFYNRTQAEFAEDIKKLVGNAKEVDEIIKDLDYVDKNGNYIFPGDKIVSVEQNSRGVITISEYGDKVETEYTNIPSKEKAVEDIVEENEQRMVIVKNLYRLNTIEAIAVVANMIGYKDKRLATNLMKFTEYGILRGLVDYAKRHSVFSNFELKIKLEDFEHALEKASDDPRKYEDKDEEFMCARIRRARSTARRKFEELGLSPMLIGL